MGAPTSVKRREGAYFIQNEHAYVALAEFTAFVRRPDQRGSENNMIWTHRTTTSLAARSSVRVTLVVPQSRTRSGERR